MSWGFTFNGEPAAVAKAVEQKAGSGCPQAVKDAVKAIAADVPEGCLLFVESSGHVADKNYEYHSGSGVLTFKITSNRDLVVTS